MVPEKKHSNTHTCPDHQPSFISFLHLLQFIASSLFSLRAWQSFCTTSVQVLLVYLLVWNPALYTPYISSPNHCLLFATHVHTIIICFAVVPRLSSIFSLSLHSLLGPLSFTFNVTNPSDHSHLCPLKCHLIFFSYKPDLTSMQHTTSHTTAVQSPSHNEWCIRIFMCIVIVIMQFIFICPIAIA